jgi:hypothetical protein
MVNSFESKPIEVTTMVFAVIGAMRLKLPASSVTVTILVPFTDIVAFGTGAPLASTTFPETPFSCAHVSRQSKIKKERRDAVFRTFFMFSFLVKMIFVKKFG